LLQYVFPFPALPVLSNRSVNMPFAVGVTVTEMVFQADADPASVVLV
jgi:hypothetical protein